MEINLLFPVLNEHKRLENGIEKTVRYMQMYVQKDPSVRYLCTILDNGSTDDTPQIGAALAARHPGTVKYVRIEEKGVRIARLTLHVGLGTFRPVKVDKIEDHHMHSEFYELGSEAADIINETRRGGGRVISVGTTSTRTLETVGTQQGIQKSPDEEFKTLQPASGWTSIFIYPGYEFKIVDSLITNFHLPESTLIMLVSAFYNRESVMDAYETAVEERYRFFSFGDSMILL